VKTNVPEYVLQAFSAQGVDTKNFIYATHTDMTKDGGYADVYTAIDRENIYILTGEEKVVKTSGARRIVALYEARDMEVFSLSELGELKTEKLISTGRLYSSPHSDDESSEDSDKNKTSKDAKSGNEADTGNPEKSDSPDKTGNPAKTDSSNEDIEERILLLFSIGFLSYAEKLTKCVKNINKNEDPFKDVLLDDELFCPKCGTRYPEPERKLCLKCLDKVSISKRLMGFFRFYLKKVIIVMIVMIAGTAFALISPLLGARFFFDEVLTVGGSFYNIVGPVVLMILLVRVIGTGLNILYSYVLARTVPWIIYDIKLRIFEAMQRLSVGFYTSKRTGALMNRVNSDSTNIYWFFVDGLPFVIVNGLTFIGIVILMCILNLRLALVCLSVIPISVLMFRILWGFFRRFHHKNWVYNSQLNSMVSDSINGQRVIKAFAREEDESERFSEVGVKQAGTETKAFNVGFTAFPIIYLFMFSGQVAITIVGGMMVINGEVTLGTFMTFIAYLSMLYGPLEFMTWVSNWWARCVDSAQRMFEIIDSRADIEDPDEPVILKDLNGDIEIKDIWFEYDPATPVLKGLNLSVPSGKTLGIVGKTGAGKSTLANLIARLYDVKEGSITINGVNVKKLPLEQLRRNIGIVSQDIYLFIGSIADNIRYAVPESTIEDVIRAAKAASAHDFIMNLPDGYETRVGSGGQDLSGGEKQRLSIARTIIQNPAILILDEATAAMDTETEANIQNSLNTLQSGRTTIAIAHRLSTLRDADSLAVIDEGKVVETGTHEELLIKKGEYQKLYTIQLEGLRVINMDSGESNNK